MEIKARVIKINTDRVKAMASITIDNSFAVNGIKVIEGKNGLFIAMPNRKRMNGEYADICFPITAEARQQITNEILKEYNKEENFVPNNSEVVAEEDLPF